MRILQITNSLRTGGAEKLLLETIPLYNQHNIKTDLLLLDGQETPFLKILQNLNCCKIFSLGNNESLYHPKWIFKIIPFLRDYDVVHVHLFPALYWSVFAKILSFGKVRMVYTEHSTTNRRRKNALLTMTDRLIYGALDKIICISYEVKIAIKRHTRLPDSRYTIISNGVNLKKIFEENPFTKEAFPISGLHTKFKLIQVSSFRYPKDQSTIIRALTRLPENVVLLLVGDGPLMRENQQLAKSLLLEGRVFFVGIRMDVNALLVSADAVVLSSAYEGLSLSCIEGLASGKPFLASQVPGLTEIVKDAGILFPFGDDHFLSEQILKLINDRVHYDKTVQNCLARAQQYDINKMIESHIKLYKSVLEN